MRRPIITLLTDFGSQDHYVASMKGVILGINPGCAIVDISHEVGPQDVRGGAFLLAQTFSFFPRGTIHLAVIDPGVGGPRKPILIVTSNYAFIGPDNGLFSLALLQEEVKEVFVLTQKKYFLPHVSQTFHGRDIFAPVAAHLSSGIRPQAFGERIDTWEEMTFGGPNVTAGELAGEIVHIDVFGNLISNIREQNIIDFTKKRAFSIKVAGRTIRAMRKGYWDGRKGEAIALIGSGGFLEITVREGNARKRLKVKRGDPVRILIDKARQHRS